ncbi:MAG TPA: isoprenylcysteine carboxylmethyltransferase family protein [Vitreimonas sp.]|uniref:methyltransferase family protein n=1 Tax=Vitreimonas sp. TaxID=3069702 RepID=UPI002D672D5C|nr:isoprenylcysteine carboxylmethyltransferase family protein [Vitreimonas sp.]HYD89003.1 isoprenylcysteine carboxylmethyltransferase family protein [Vitreimonas sp.]
MTAREAFIGSAAFFLAAPVVVAGLIPWLITRWRPGEDASLQLTIVGTALTAAGFAALVDCFMRFALKGGTPAPIAPTGELVVSGLYRYVRNPMYLGVLLAIVGQMLVFANAGLLAYAVLIALIFHFFVLGYEEPKLKKSFPEAYAAYCENVGRWLPRLTPWTAQAPGALASASPKTPRT